MLDYISFWLAKFLTDMLIVFGLAAVVWGGIYALLAVERARNWLRSRKQRDNK